MSIELLSDFGIPVGYTIYILYICIHIFCSHERVTVGENETDEYMYMCDSLNISGCSWGSMMVYDDNVDDDKYNRPVYVSKLPRNIATAYSIRTIENVCSLLKHTFPLSLGPPPRYYITSHCYNLGHDPYFM